MDFNYLNNFNNLLLDIEGNNIEEEEPNINMDDTSLDDKTDFKNKTKPKYKTKPLNKIFVIPDNKKSKNKY